MKIKIVTVGKVKQEFVREGEGEFLERMRSEHKFEFIELDSKASRSASPAEIRRRESELFLSHVRRSTYTILLDEKGKELSSPQLADFLKERMTRGSSSLLFAIGGAHGWDDEARKSAGFILSLSRLTFPYQLTRLILVEQLYRAFSILKGTPYHKA